MGSQRTFMTQNEKVMIFRYLLTRGHNWPFRCLDWIQNASSILVIENQGLILTLREKRFNPSKSSQWYSKTSLNISTVELPVKSSLSDILSWQDCGLISPSFPTEPTVNPFVSGVNSFQARQIRSLNTLCSTFYKTKAYLIAGPLHESFRKGEISSKIMLPCL